MVRNIRSSAVGFFDIVCDRLCSLIKKGKKMKIFNLVVEILWLITSVSFLIQDVRRWKNDKKEREFNKWLEERRKDFKTDEERIKDAKINRC